jgi:Secretion system C-terminal sorting domain/Matrixin
MKKLITILITSCCLVLSAKAQTIVDSNLLNYAIQLSPIVFEGEVVQQCTYDDPNTGIIYTNNIVQISKLIKGQLNCGTVSITTEGGEYNGRGLSLSHQTQFTRNFAGIFICQISDYPSTSICPATDNLQKLKPLARENSEIEYYNDYVNEVAIGLNSQFNDINELYDFIQLVSGYQVIDCNSASFNVKAWGNNNFTRPQSKIDIEKPDVPLKKKRTNPTIEYSFGIQSIKTTGSTKNYVIPIRIKSDDSTKYFDEGAFRIKFNIKSFGTNIASNILVQLGNNFDPATYLTIQNINKSDSVFSIWIHQAAGALNRTKLKLTNQTLVTLTIPYDSCQFYPNISFDTFATILNYTYFTDSANSIPSNRVMMDSVIANDARAGSVCNPLIYDVTSDITASDTVAAGRGEDIRIKGIHFGDKKGKIFLPNANKTNLVFTKLDQFDIKSWTDTLIIYELPSMIDSGYKANTSSTSYNRSTPGTGNHVIVNNWTAVNDSASSSSTDNIFIEYAATEYSRNKGTSNYYKNNVLLFTRQTDSAYTIRLDTSITNTGMKDCIRSAINKWRCAIGVNLKLSSTTTNVGIKDDNINCIAITKVDSFATLAETYDWTIDTCTGSGANKPPHPRSNIDIAINRARVPEFYYDTTGIDPIPFGKYDFLGIMLHELGHAIGLQHVKQNYDLMYPNSLRGPYPASSRVNINFFDQNGGDYVMSRSTSLSGLGLSCGVTLRPQSMQDTNCRVFPLFIQKQIEKTSEYIDVYPNPANTSLNIIMSDDVKKYANYQIMDISGRVLQSDLLKSKNNKIEIEKLQDGIYILIVKKDGLWFSKRIIKQ